MSTVQARAVSVAATMSSAGQSGFGVQRRQLALERYVAAIAGDDPSVLHVSGAHGKVRTHDDSAPAAESTVSSVMVAAVSLPRTTMFADVLRALAAHAISAVTVVDQDGVPVGVVSEADLLLHVVADDGPPAHTRRRRGPRAAQKDTVADLTAGDLMSSPAITTTPDASITQAATVAAHAHVKVLPVVDGNGRVVGMVSRAAILGAYLQEAEQRPR